MNINHISKNSAIAAALLIAIGMTLAVTGCKKNQATPQPALEHQDHAAAKYQCPMHPQVVSDKPGACPICHMDLVLIESQPQKVSSQTSPETGEVSGQADVHMTEGKEQLIGVRTARVEKRDLEMQIRASAKIAFDPDLYNAITEYKEAASSRNKAKESSWKDVEERAESLVQSSLMRLRLMGISERQANQLASSPNLKNLLLAESGGKVWVYAQIFEYESPFVKAGQLMEVSSPAFPGQKFQGEIKSVDSVLKPETRSLKVRAEIGNPNSLLKPEMFVEAVIHAKLGRKLAVPKEAVMDTGTRQLVFVQTGPGHFEPHSVKLGAQAEGYVEVISGLQENDEVSVSGNFLIDSESKLKAAVTGAAHQH